MQEAEPQKAIPTRRDHLQSLVLVVAVTPLLGFAAVCPVLHAARFGLSITPWIATFLLSFCFAALVWLLKAATLPASGIGLLVCVILSQPMQKQSLQQGAVAEFTLSQTAFPALAMLFLLTFLATRFGRVKKEGSNLAEKRSGRRASQIIANLGIAALCVSVAWHRGGWWYSGCVAALAEATADTVSSEVGQAMGGPVWLITTWRGVPTGTNGGISLGGTVSGSVAAGLVVIAGMTGPLFAPAPLVFAAACTGLFFD
ncbi:MAG: DUF92 domain-containing protein, partial [Edaphobacter sp.]